MGTNATIIWITKIHSPTMTGGTRVSAGYIREIGLEGMVEVVEIGRGDARARFAAAKRILSLAWKAVLAPESLRLVFDDHWALLALLFPSTPTVMFYHGNWPQQFRVGFVMALKGMVLFPMYVLGFVACTRTIFVNPYFERMLMPLCRASVTLLNPISLRRATPDEHRRSGRPVCGVVGNVDRRKYVDMLQFMRDGDCRSLGHEFEIFGKIVDPGLADELRRAGAKIVGFVERVPYESLDYLVSFSRAENLPLSIFEALSHGVNCLLPAMDQYQWLREREGVFLYKDFGELRSIIRSQRHSRCDTSFFDKISFRGNWEKAISGL